MNEITKIEEQIRALFQTPEWKESFELSSREVKKTLEKLHEDCKVDPKLLDEPLML